MKTITIELTDLEWKAMADIVEDPDEWAQRAVLGKKQKCIKNVVAKEQQRLLNSSRKTMPATIEEILKSHFAQPNYKTRAERETLSSASMADSMVMETSGSE